MIFLPGTGRGTGRRLVEGAGRRRHDHRHHGLDIPQHIAGGHTQHPVAILREKSVAISIALNAIAAAMEFAIDLYRQLGSSAVEVANIGAKGMLVAEFEAGLLSSQMLPKQHLWKAHLAA